MSSNLVSSITIGSAVYTNERVISYGFQIWGLDCGYELSFNGGLIYGGTCGGGMDINIRY